MVFLVRFSDVFARGGLIIHKKFFKKTFRPFKAFLCHTHRFRFPFGIGNEAFCMKSVHCIPIKSLPCSCPETCVSLMDHLI